MTEQEQPATEPPSDAPPPVAPPPAVESELAAEPAPAELIASAPAEDAAPRPAPRAERPEGDRPERSEGGPRERGGGRRHFGRRKVCAFCVEKVKTIDYKDPMRLRRYLSDRARIEPRRKTGTCAKHQRWLATALKRARHLALLPYTPEHIRASGMFAGRR